MKLMFFEQLAVDFREPKKRKGAAMITQIANEAANHFLFFKRQSRAFKRDKSHVKIVHFLKVH